MALVIPPKPEKFDHELPPPGFRKQLVSFWQTRPLMRQGGARLQLFHTNGAQREGSVQSAINHAERAPNQNTCPHLQIDRGGKGGALLLPSNRRGVGNATFDSNENKLNSTPLDDYDVSWFSLVFETADTGTLDDPTISAYDESQLQLCSNAAAYYHMLCGIPLEIPTEWYGYGTASHTDPFGTGYWTLYAGKICPGAKKKSQLRNIILPFARQIAAKWKAPVVVVPPIPPPSTVGTYTVLAGEGWYRIAVKLSVSMGALLEVNGATVETILQPGQVIKVPGAPKPPPPPTDWVSVGSKMATTSVSPQLLHGMIHDNVPWLQAILCSLPKLPADQTPGNTQIFNPAWVGSDSIKAGASVPKLFGDATKSALMYWQSKNFKVDGTPLTVDGVWGAQTGASMAKARGM